MDQLRLAVTFWNPSCLFFSSGAFCKVIEAFLFLFFLSLFHAGGDLE